MRRLGSRGDTIVEVLLSMTILAVVGVTAFATSTRSFHSSINSQLRDQGISYAQQQLELLKNVDNGAANMATYVAQTSNFCVNPSDLAHPAAATGLGCSTASTDFKVYDKYDPSTKTFTITSNWTSANGQPTQTVLYYKPGSSYVTCTSGSCTAITPPTTGTTTNPPSYSINISSPTPQPIAYNGSINLTWNTSNIIPGSCQAIGNWAGDLGGGNASDTNAGYNQTGLTSSTSSFDIKCKDLTGTYHNSNSGPVVATVTQPPAVTFNSFSASPSTIYAGDSTRITWSTSNATTCTGNNGLNTGGATSNAGGVLLAPSSNTSYTLSCKRADNTTTDTSSIFVTVNPIPYATLNQCANSNFGACSLGASFSISQGTGQINNPLGVVPLANLNYTYGNFPLTMWDDRGACENFYFFSAGLNNAISGSPGTSGSGSYCAGIGGQKVYRNSIVYLAANYTDCIYGYSYASNQSHTYGTWNGHACQ
jgi:hypothetical protein